MGKNLKNIEIILEFPCLRLVCLPIFFLVVKNTCFLGSLQEKGVKKGQISAKSGIWKLPASVKLQKTQSIADAAPKFISIFF